VADQLMKPTFDACPDPETLAAYLDGRLTAAERTAMAEHLATCEDCYSVFSESARVQFDEPSDRHTVVPLWRKFVLPATGLAAAAVLALIVQTGGTPWLRPSNRVDVAELVAAVGTQRMIEPRITGEFAYGPLRSAVRSGQSTRNASSPDMRIASAKIEKVVERSRTPQTLAALGKALLATGEGEKAVPVLEEATSTAAPDPHALSDLAAAYLVRSEQKKDPAADLESAVSAADKAIKLDPTIAEAWFNRALALEKKSSFADAQTAWDDYLRIDSHSPWANEARIHLQRLQKPAVRP
jgi:tetratricopeptide (TPR) repeat protein